MPGKRRCYLHGGRVPGGYRGQPIEPAWAKRAAKQALFRALGIPWYGGPPRKVERIVGLREEALDRLKQDVAVLEERLAPDVMSRELDELAAPEALGRAALSGIRQMIRIIEQPLDMEDLKQQRLIGDISVAAGKLYMRAAEGAFKARQAGALDKLLEMLEVERAEKKETEGG